MIILLPILAAIVGLVLYALAGNPKIAELGRITFMVGLFWTVGELLHTTLRLLTT